MNNYYNHYTDPDFYIRKEAQKKEIKTLGFYTGLALLCQIILQNGISFLMEALGIMDKYINDGIYQNAVDIILVIIGLLIPFYFVSKKMKEVSRIPEPVPLNKPFNWGSFILAVVSGIGFCMFANIVTSYFTYFIGFFGVELSSPDIAMPGGFVGILTSIIRIVVIAAVTEEITMRGYVMGNLRKYGDMFAVTVSALVFAVMHGNLVQAPFALIVGFALGYLSIKTGTVWTGIVIHAMNNLISTAVSYSFDYLGEETANFIYMLALYGFIILGLICYRFFKIRTKHIYLRKDMLLSSTKEKISAFFLNPAMILALAYMLYITIQYVGLKI